MFSTERLEELRAETTRTLDKQRKKLVRRRDAIASDLARVGEAEELARVAALAAPLAASVRRGSEEHERRRLRHRRSGDAHDRARPGTFSARVAREHLRDRAPFAKGAPLASKPACARPSRRSRRWTKRSRPWPLHEDEDELLAARGPSSRRRNRPRRNRRKNESLRTERSERRAGRSSSAAARRETTSSPSTSRSRTTCGSTRAASPERTSSSHFAAIRRARRSLLVDAAHLAAHFSDARGERTVEVTLRAAQVRRRSQKAARQARWPSSGRRCFSSGSTTRTWRVCWRVRSIRTRSRPSSAVPARLEERAVTVRAGRDAVASLSDERGGREQLRLGALVGDADRTPPAPFPLTPAPTAHAAASGCLCRCTGWPPEPPPVGALGLPATPPSPAALDSR